MFVRLSRFAFLLVSVPGLAIGQTGVNPGGADIPAPPDHYSPYVERSSRDNNFAKGLYWGDTKLHTSYSTDAEAPTFMIGAAKDPWSGNLDRIQVVKGWVDADGDRQENIYDVACADRMIVNGKCDGPVGNTVDEESASFLNNIGDAEMRVTWTDPDFNTDLPAVYYVRVLEIPTPTWQAHDQAYFRITMEADVPLSHQERAHTSPIWYTP